MAAKQARPQRSPNAWLDSRDILRRYNIGVELPVFLNWVRLGQYPAPDITINAKSRFWFRSTADRWAKEHLGGRRREVAHA
jgi:hypothetical protein